ncbi:hypothetical protein [Silvanigrella aquatica]|uniref:Lipoprotein n=1 Tax=Silvanigrella aquatica TaxID=1915309 RepID=A0A1L4CYP3_9BACT|nr:hypothetical protein [Silvanigrella aquatica]APJ03057.1 hypothetical protein AXG55_03680 [Silvanigrella aquatica]
MLNNRILAACLTLTAVSLYSCKGDENGGKKNANENLPMTYLKVSLSGTDKVISTASKNTKIYQFNAKIECVNVFGNEKNYTQIFDYKSDNENNRIILVKDKTCFITFLSFKGLHDSNSEAQYKPSMVGTSLTLTWDGTKIQKSDKIGHYVHPKTLLEGTPPEYENRYVNGSSTNNTLNLYYTKNPDTDPIEILDANKETINIETNEINSTFKKVSAPAKFPLKIIQTNYKIGSNTQAKTAYTIKSAETPENKNWPESCKLFTNTAGKEITKSPKDWISTNELYNDSTQLSVPCSTINLSQRDNWEISHRSQYIILANTEGGVSSYSVMTLPKK